MRSADVPSNQWRVGGWSWDEGTPSLAPDRGGITPLKSKIDTQNDGPWKMYLLSNMAILGIYVRFQGGRFIKRGVFFPCTKTT